MRDTWPRFRALGVAVVAISFATPARLRAFAEQMALPFPLLSDLDRSTYHRYGLPRASPWAVSHPRVLWRSLGLLLRERRLLCPHEDTRQLGGDFVLDRQGHVRLAHRGADPLDWPPVATLLRAVEATGRV